MREGYSSYTYPLIFLERTVELLAQVIKKLIIGSDLIKGGKVELRQKP